MKTTIAKDPGANRTWHVVDATDRPLGRLAAGVARVLRGKHKVTFTPHVDDGDFVVVVNAAKVKLTGRKEETKVYSRYTGYRAGLKRVKAGEMRRRHPDRMIRLAVKGMLPTNALSRKMIVRLKVYAGAEHPHAAQKPQTLNAM